MSSLENGPDKLSRKKEIPKNVVEVETENATYRISYELHNATADPDLVDGADGIILEGYYNYDIRENIPKAFRGFSETQMKGVIARSAEQDKPVFSADMSVDLLKFASLCLENPVKKKLIEAGELLIGMGLIQSAISEIRNTEKISRRNFLRTTGKMIGGAYFGMPAIESVLAGISILTKKILDESSDLRKFSRGLEKVNEYAHPELQTMAIEVRNQLIAQKAETIATQLREKIGKKPNLAIYIGASHFGIEEALKSTQSDRMAKLRTIFKDELVKQAKIIQYNPKQDSHGKVFCESFSILEDPAFLLQPKDYILVKSPNPSQH